MGVRRLPRNRSEAFYTGTVLPMLACGNGLDGLRPLLIEAGAAEDAVAPGQPLELMIEYDHVKSIAGLQDEWPTRPAVSAVPDLLVFADGDIPTLVAFEAKMFHRPSPGALAKQLDDQRSVLEAIATDLEGEVDLVQAVLAPQGFLNAVTVPDGVATLTWEQVLELYPDADPRWRSVLKDALDAYETSKSKTVKIFDAKVLGEELAGDASEWGWVGVHGGVNGLQTLIGSDWPKREFEVRRDAPPWPNSNWMPIQQFRDILGLDEETGPPEAGVEPIPPLQAAVVMSWKIVLELFDHLRLDAPAVVAGVFPNAETFYDLLEVQSPTRPGREVVINRPGSIHLVSRREDVNVSIPWRDYIADRVAVFAQLIEWLGGHVDERPDPVAGDERRRFAIEVMASVDLWRVRHSGLTSTWLTEREPDPFGYQHRIDVADLGVIRLSEFGGVWLGDRDVRNLWREAGGDPAVGGALLLGWIGAAIARPDTSPPRIDYSLRHDIDGTPAFVAAPDADMPETWRVWREGSRDREEVSATPFVVEFPRELRGRPAWPTDVTIEGPTPSAALAHRDEQSNGG